MRKRLFIMLASLVVIAAASARPAHAEHKRFYCGDPCFSSDDCTFPPENTGGCILCDHAGHAGPVCD
jgi:hypothetical protein